MAEDWCRDSDLADLKHSVLAQRAYTSRLLGQNPDLVLHGGGNTSIKGTKINIFGHEEPTLFVKGSGFDLRTIQEEGFAACRLSHLLRLSELDRLSDIEMMRELRSSLFDPSDPTPSVEAIVHAVLPHRVVDHTHADAVVAISNTPDGETLLRDLYGPRVVVLPYVMPGFVLAKQIAALVREVDMDQVDAIVLMHHGVFTFADQVDTSYRNMIGVVTKAEEFLRRQGITGAADNAAGRDVPPLALAEIRAKACELAGRPVLASFRSHCFGSDPRAPELLTCGPLTPDHVIHTKPFAAVFQAGRPEEVDAFAKRYRDYFSEHGNAELACLDLAPRTGLWVDHGLVAFADTGQRLSMVQDIVDHTIVAARTSQQLGGWCPASREDVFDLEYWELEQAKLKRHKTGGTFQGKVVVVTGAASGIGRACVSAFLEQGACVVGLDRDQEVARLAHPSSCYLGTICDVTVDAMVDQALQQAVYRFGGIDVLISNAGSFPQSSPIEETPGTAWQESLQVNLSAHFSLLQKSTPFLKVGVDPVVIFVGSKNVAAPGPGAASYSVAKAGLAQLARVAALELGSAGVRVQVIHPDAVFDTGLWTDQVLAERAKRYEISVEAYKRRNVLGTQVSSFDVANVVRVVASPVFSKVTGAQIPVDGGNDRVV